MELNYVDEQDKQRRFL